MKKEEFLNRLKRRLYDLPRRDVKERVIFYSEMIDDRMEEGLTEEEAVEAVGTVDEIFSQITAEKVLSGSKRNSSKSSGLKSWEIAILILGSPIWGSLLIAGFVVIWSLNIALCAVELPFFICSYISKGLFLACKWMLKESAKITAATVEGIKNLFT